ncbi:hypothetical protein EDD18DRAFT_1362406 [Armillaria luteobubalina]|uniref:Uncharacterized protein n=1 Tax=Armillaria luteobubalina TaxID=153913 RepID=A0AA39PEQ5_9AGAR|nr:hypothetical protein EDD18DRAFT_1362406 [Armillaria luteobubalina]
MTPPSQKCYLNSLDSTQLSQLVLALEEHGLISAALPTTLGPTHLALRSESDQLPISPSLSGGEATVSIANMAMSIMAVPETRRETPSSPSKLTHAHPAGRSTWYTITIGYQVRIFQGWNTIAPLVLDVDGTAYLPHPSHATTCTHYVNAMANNKVKIVLTDSKDDG